MNYTKDKNIIENLKGILKKMESRNCFFIKPEEFAVTNQNNDKLCLISNCRDNFFNDKNNESFKKKKLRK